MLTLRWPNLYLTLPFSDVSKWYFRGTMQRCFSRWVMFRVIRDVGWRNPPCLVTLSDTSIKFLIYKTGWFQIFSFATLTIGWSPTNDHHFSNFIPFHQPTTGCSNMFQHALGETRHVWWTYSSTQKHKQTVKIRLKPFGLLLYVNVSRYVWLYISLLWGGVPLNPTLHL